MRRPSAARIVVIDIQSKRLEAAQRFGATDVIDSTKAKPVEAVHDLLPRGADHVFDFVGLKRVAEQGLAMLGVGGGLYLIGVSTPEINVDLNIFNAIGGCMQGTWRCLRWVMSTTDYSALKDGSLNRVVVTSFES